MHITISIHRLCHYLVGVIILLIVLSLSTALIHLYWPQVPLIEFLDLNSEQNLPTLFSCLLLGVAALLNGLIGRLYYHRNNFHYWGWAGLVGIFSFLTMDEFMSIHEHLIEPMRDFFKVTGWLHYAWVIPYSAIVVVIGGLYLRFLYQLPRQTRHEFALAGGMFLAGSIGLEMVGGYVASQIGKASLAYILSYTVEETLEMLGVTCFIRALLLYLQPYPIEIQIQADHRARPPQQDVAPATATDDVHHQQSQP